MIPFPPIRNPNTFQAASSSIGLLNTIEPRYWVNFTSTAELPILNGFQQVPYFQSASSADVDGIIGSALQKVLVQLAEANKTVITLRPSRRNPIDVAAYYNNISQTLTAMPYGGNQIH